MLRRLLACLVFLALPAAALAQERPSAILVLDASGSMWGQIDGVNKIVIAREVVSDLLDTLPGDQALGLVAYGHRTKGDCGDIELLYQPGTDRAAIRDAVMSLSPKGKTPLSAAVIQAAEALKYTEETATVILVSDGIETCDYDPCEVGRQLEQTGVSFTAHVIGFDVADPEAKAQLQCLAEETGGTFRSASDAGELADALEEVAAAPPPAPVVAPLSFAATEGENGPLIDAGLVWSVTAGDTTLAEGLEAAQPDFELAEGIRGTATVIRLADEAVGEASFVKTGASQVVTIALPKFVPSASIEAPASAPAGSVVSITFTGPRQGGDYIASARAGLKEGRYDEYSYVEKAEGDTLKLRLPPVPGTATLFYVLGKGRDILASTTIEVTPLDVSITAPEGATIGQVERIDWSGPDYDADYIALSVPDDEDGRYVTYEYTNRGNPAKVTMPAEPGTYELRYVLGASRTIVGRSAPFEVAETATSVSGPAEAVGGATIKVDWVGPDAKSDYISIARIGDEDGKYVLYEYTARGNPAKIAAPTEPGDYEIRYVMNQDRTVLARAPLTVTEVTATLTAPDTAVAGEPLRIDWEGPDYQSDYISVARPDDEGPGRYVRYEYTNRGNPAKLPMPTEAGEYELRYVVHGKPDRIIATRPVTVTEVTATLTAPDSAAAGAKVNVGWEGPDYQSDYISVARPEDEEPGSYVGYEYTNRGNPAKLAMPTDPGTYELRYVVHGKPDRIIATRQITVTEAGASIEAPDQAPAGSPVRVTWSGPDNQNNYLSVAEIDSDAGSYISYEYTNQGSPLTMAMPTEPGSYELRYILTGRPDTVIASHPITVTESTASLSAPASGAAGSEIRVDWEGPDYPLDFLSLARPDDGASGYVTYAYTERGTPAQMTLPDEPGTYELRYVLTGRPDDRVIARQSITVE